MQITTSSTTIALTDGSSHGAAPREVSKKTLWGAAALVAILYGSLWSPHWYPLSDSALYLSLGKSLAHGDGFQFLGESHRLAAPLTPIMIAVAMRLGGDFGTLHALMIGLMLIGLLLAYLTLKQWVGQRAALGATVAASLSFWVAQCVTTIMTEPLCMALLWGMMLALTLAARAQKRWRRGWLFALAIFLLLAGFENRVAMILLLPGIVVAIWWSAEFASRKERLVWIGCFCFVLGTAFWDYRYGGHSVDFISQASARVRSDSVEVPPMPDSRAVVPPATPNSSLMEAGAAPTVGSAVSASEKQFGTPSAHRIEKSIPKAYARQNSRYGVTLPPVSTMFRYPYYFGRWICEGMIAPSIILFQTENEFLLAVGSALSLGALALFCLGAWRMLAQRQCWAMCIITYSLPIWLIWSARIIPRYTVPFAPLVFLLLWQGASWLLARFVSWKRETASDPQPYGRLAFVGLLLLMLLGNTPPLAIELYLRHAPGADFYQVARRGATKELIDISAYIRANSQPTDMVGCNAYFFHRVVHYLTTKPVKQLDLSKPHRYQAMKSSQCRYVVVFSTQDAPWPNWHLPFVNEAEPASWWRLYERQESGKYKHIDPTVYEIAKTNAISTK